jgi:hypothetical protein
MKMALVFQMQRVNLSQAATASLVIEEGLGLDY